MVNAALALASARTRVQSSERTFTKLGLMQHVCDLTLGRQKQADPESAGQSATLAKILPF